MSQITTIYNDKLRIKVSENGAELISIYNITSDYELLWNGDPIWWGRHSPVLFPNVGMLKDKKYFINDKWYSLPQHGFARDSVFELVSRSDNSICYSLVSNEVTLANYPFNFRLDIEYRLDDNKVTVLWRVVNTGNEEMPFSIGAHPAFMCPPQYSKYEQKDCYIIFDNKGPIKYRLLGEGDCIDLDEHTLLLDDNKLRVDEHLFDKGAYIIENHQLSKLSLATPDGKEYVSIDFKGFPMVGIWSKPGAPFVCLEPWYGEADEVNSIGDFKQKKGIQLLQPKEEFTASYTIEI